MAPSFAHAFFLGPSKDHANRLVAVLRMYDSMIRANCGALPVPPLLPENRYPARGNQEYHTFQHTMITKYYVANLKCWTQAWDGCPSDDALSVVASENAEAVVCTFDAAEPGGFADLRDHWGSLFRTGESAFSVQIVVAVNASGASAKDRDEWFEWCISRCIELIEMDLSDPTSGHAEREKEGFPRLVEALQSNMWSSMVQTGGKAAEPKTKTMLLSMPSPPAADAPRAGSSGPGPGPDTAAPLSSVADRKGSPPSGSGSSRDEPQASGAAPAPAAEGTPAAGHADSGQAHAVAAASDDQAGRQRHGQQDGRQEKEARPQPAAVDALASLDSFDSMLSQVQEIRSQAAGMPDDVRRARAAEMAMRLMTLIGDGDDEEDEGGEDGDGQT